MAHWWILSPQKRASPTAGVGPPGSSPGPPSGSPDDGSARLSQTACCWCTAQRTEGDGHTVETQWDDKAAARSSQFTFILIQQGKFMWLCWVQWCHVVHYIGYTDYYFLVPGLKTTQLEPPLPLHSHRSEIIQRLMMKLSECQCIVSNTRYLAVIYYWILIN